LCDEPVHRDTQKVRVICRVGAPDTVVQEDQGRSSGDCPGRPRVRELRPNAPDMTWARIGSTSHRRVSRIVD
jgi:hypothetical protein